MKRISLASLIFAALASVVILLAAQESLSGQGKGSKIVGTWQTSGSVINCQTGATLAPFIGLNTFLESGSMFSTGASNPALTSTGYGVWEHEGARRFTNTILSFRFNADGSYAGSTKITRAIEVDGSGDTFTSTNSLELADPAGTVMATRCSTETGRRLE